MQIDNLLDLGWSNYFQSQLDLESLESQLPFRVVSVQRNLIECIGLDKENHQKHLQLSTYYWRHETPEAHPTIGDWVMVNLEFKPLHILERKTLIKRRGAGRESFIQLMASNIACLSGYRTKQFSMVTLTVRQKKEQKDRWLGHEQTAFLVVSEQNRHCHG